MLLERKPDFDVSELMRGAGSGEGRSADGALQGAGCPLQDARAVEEVPARPEPGHFLLKGVNADAADLACLGERGALFEELKDGD